MRDHVLVLFLYEVGGIKTLTIRYHYVNTFTAIANLNVIRRAH